MKLRQYCLFFICALWLTSVSCSGVTERTRGSSDAIKNLVGPAQQSVATVITYDADGDIAAVASGFFLTKSGVLVTNFHVLEGAYGASVRTRDGRIHPVSAVLNDSRQVDLVKVRVEIPRGEVKPVERSGREPVVAEPVFVVGSPMGLEQTVSEGIVSAIRDLPTGGKILQLTAPISQGSSGGPVFDADGAVIGVVTFQAAKGQNLNFAVGIDALDLLSAEPRELSVAEWTIRTSKQGPAMAALLCRKGTRLSIQGEYEEALAFFQRAAETDPQNPDVWYGLGSCYAGLNQAEDAVAAYRMPIAQDPDNARAHFILAMYYKAMQAYDLALPPLREVIRIEPGNVRARFELGRVYGHLERTEDQIDAFETILSRHPNHVPTLMNLGVAFGRVDRFAEAMEAFDQATELEPDNALLHYNMGVTFSRMKQPERAIRAYTQAIRNNPRLVPAHFNLGTMYLEQGRRKLALDQYEILKSLDADAAGRLFDRIYPEKG